MIRALKSLLAAAAVMIMFVACGPTVTSGGGCSNDSQCGNQFCQNGSCVQCKQDSHCNGQDKTMACNNFACNRVPGACANDSQCPSGQRCLIMDSSKAYGQCGNRR